ncbi:MAG: type IX secretion system outer membrane channel protein PorV [Chloroherpetonaceae bacterium]|nr:type IX secretion system outer membrane channel protein PorV [Chloroherpetonaceae bacterium]MDW8437577.1 type IX secretion system outer membrane channel protein PorV [Chloroherpetonaceae bacterium]
MRTFSPKALGRVALCVAIFGTMTSSANAQRQPRTITTAVPFLLISPDSRAGGMGEANVAIADNASAMFWNPAGLGFQKGLDVNFTHANWLPAFNADLFYDNLTIKRHFAGFGTFGLGITYLNLGETEVRTAQNVAAGTIKSYEFAVTGSYGARIAQSLAVGTSVRFIRSALTNVGAGSEQGAGIGTSISFDLALLWKPQFGGYFADRWSFGLNISNIGPKMTYIDEAQADPLPTNFKIGFAYRVLSDKYNSLTLAADFNKLLVNRSAFLDGRKLSPDEVNRLDSASQRRVTYRADNVFSAMISSWGASGGGFRSFTVGVGAEYWYGSPQLLALRAGYFYEDPEFGGRRYLTFGAGVRYAAFGVDFSYLQSVEQQHPLDGTVRLSLVLNFPNIGLKQTKPVK